MKIWIFAELSRRRLSQVALELISCARGLAADAKVTAVLIGHDLDAAIRDAAAVGAAQIIAADHPLLENYDDMRVSQEIELGILEGQLVSAASEAKSSSSLMAR